MTTLLKRMTLTVISLFCLISFSHAQNIISCTNYVQMKISFPLMVNDTCVARFDNPGLTIVTCEFELGFKPIDPYNYRVDSVDLYFEYNFEISGQKLILTFINSLWLDAKDFVPGDEVTFKEEVINHFQGKNIDLVLTYNGPDPR